MRFHFLFIALFLLPSLFQSRVVAQDMSIYVWNFSDRSGGMNDLTASLTDEFEEALLQTDCCEILQRRTYARLFQHRENERAISGYGNLSSDSKSRLKDIQANTVVFGEVYDDTNSGQVKVSASFEKLNGTIDKRASVYMAKYDINNPSKREEAMLKLIDELRLTPNNSAPIATEQVDEWTFALKGCQRIGKDVKCSYVVTSNYRDRNFVMGGYSKAYDEYNYEYAGIKTQKLANKTSSSNLSLQLIDGIPASGFITFGNVSSRATKFPLLEFAVRGDDLSVRSFQFRDVPIE